MIGAVLRAAVVVTLLTGPAQAGCLAFCGDGILAPEAALDVLQSELGAPLPEGVVIEGMLEGGFQDRFVQIKLTATPEGTKAMLAALAVDPATLTPGSGHAFGAAAADFWDVETRDDLRFAEGRLGTFAYTRVALATDASGAAAIYIFAFET